MKRFKVQIKNYIPNNLGILNNLTLQITNTSQKYNCDNSYSFMKIHDKNS